MRPRWFAALVLICCPVTAWAQPASPPAAAAARPHWLVAPGPMEAMDLYRLSMVTSPRVAPDGRRVVFTRAAFDLASDRRTSELWLAHLDDAGAVVDRRMLVGRDLAPSQAQISPDGSRLAFVGQHAGRPQIHVLAFAEGVARPLTTGDVTPSTPTWSPDGRRLAFIGRVPAERVRIAGIPEGPRGSQRAPQAKVIDDLVWRRDGAGELQPGAFHVFLVDATTGELRQLTRGERDAAVPGAGLAWTPDGGALVWTVQDEPERLPRESRLARLDVGRQGAPPTTLVARPGSASSPAFSPDGRQLLFLGAERSEGFYAMPTLWLASADGGNIRALAADLDRPVIAARWTADGAIVAQYHDAGVTRIARIDPATGARTLLVPEVGGTRLYLPSAGGEMDEGGGTLAYTSSFTDRPAGLGITRVGAGRETGALDLNAEWAALRTAGRLERVTATSRADGLEIEGWLLHPPGFDPRRRYPIILDIHGGPNTDYGPFFSITHHLYAAAGYLVLFANPRGSIGYGEAFANAITGAYPGRDHDDLMSILDAVVARPYADAGRQFIGGGSGGGVLTLWAIGMEPERFRGAVALRPVTDWFMQATTSDIQAVTAFHWLRQPPWEAPEAAWALSPASLVGRVQTPTLLITGEEDWRTPISQTEQVYGALKLRGVDARMIRLPGASHGMGRPSQWLESILAPIQWFDERQTARPPRRQAPAPAEERASRARGR